MSCAQRILEAAGALSRRLGIHLADAEASVLESVEAGSMMVVIEPQSYRPVQAG